MRMSLGLGLDIINIINRSIRYSKYSKGETKFLKVVKSKYGFGFYLYL